MRCLLPIVLISLCSHACAQEHHRLAGYVQMPGSPLTSHYVDITISGQNVAGYSVTDYKQGNRLKAAVRGRLASASELYIEETKMLSRLEPGSTYCFFTAYLKLNVVNGRKRWAGPFESRKADGRLCDPGRGFMTLMDDAPPLDAPTLRAQPNPPAITAAPPMRKLPPRPPKPPIRPKDMVAPLLKPETPKARPVMTLPKAVPVPSMPPDTNNCMRSYDWTSDTLSFALFDGWTVDGDVVSLSVGEQSLLNHATLSELKRQFTVPLARGLNLMLISLYDEGYVRSNTPNLILYDGPKKYALSISGNAGEVVRICIFRK